MTPSHTTIISILILSTLILFAYHSKKTCQNTYQSLVHLSSKSWKTSPHSNHLKEIGNLTQHWANTNSLPPIITPSKITLQLTSSDIPSLLHIITQINQIEIKKIAIHAQKNPTEMTLNFTPIGISNAL